MTKTRRSYWPRNIPHALPEIATTISANLEVSAARYPNHPAVSFFGQNLTYRELRQQSDAFAGWLQVHAGVREGDRVLLFLQNCPQWLVAYYGILRAGAVVVPINPMSREADVRYYLSDSGATVAVCAQELADTLAVGAKDTEVRHVVVASYSDYLPAQSPFPLPEWVCTPAAAIDGCINWASVINAGYVPMPSPATPDSLAMLGYTSGSTGSPKACMHTHRTFMHNVAGNTVWHGFTSGTIFLGMAPMYQVSGLLISVNCAIFAGGTVVPVLRWDRDLVAQLIAHYRISYAGLAPTAINDLISSPDFERYDLSSVRRMSSGGSTMPEGVWKRLNEELKIPFIEAYGLTETAGTTLINPIERPKPQCLGVPFFGTEVRIMDPADGKLLGPNQPGEILISAPQVFKGYWNKPEATAQAFVEIDGKRFFRTGDIGRYDDEGYFFMTDRLKRMINASGFKVWPAEIETKLYEHPDVLEACVVGTADPYRGETVKAVIVLRPGSIGRVTDADIREWAKRHMAAYKYPRVIEFIDALPKSPVGKILWRELQDKENAGIRTEAASASSPNV
jgi:fatty-acyl-CoA synthase